MSNKSELRAELEALKEKEDAARREFEALQFANAERIRELNAKLRDDDLATVKELCKLHGFTATELRGALKGKGAPKKVAESIANTTGTGRGRPKGSKNKPKA